jgi:hypothetical protein
VCVCIYIYKPILKIVWTNFHWLWLAAIPMNKQLYSFSFVCFTAGAAGIVFSGFYILVSQLIFPSYCEYIYIYIYDMIVKGRERDVELSDNLMTLIKFDISIIFLFNIRKLIRHIKYIYRLFQLKYMDLFSFT